MKINNYSDLNLDKVVRVVDLIVPAKNAKLGPPVGPILGQFKIKVKAFCDSFNSETSDYPINLPLGVTIYIYKDDSFNYTIKTPSTMFLILNSEKPLSPLTIYKIAMVKNLDLEHLSIKSILKSVLATARSMKLKIN